MLAVEQLGQKPFKWMEGLNDGLCPEIDGPFRAVLENHYVVFRKTSVGDYWRLIVTPLWDGFYIQHGVTHGVTYDLVEHDRILTVFKMINLVLSGEETHPDHEEFDAFFKEYDVIRFIP